MNPVLFTKELNVFDHRVRFDAGNNIMYIVAIGDSDLEIATIIRDFTNKVYDEVDGDINTIIDLNETGKSTPEARKIWKEMGDHERAHKIAFVGLHPVARVVADFAIRMGSKKNCRFFGSQEEALKWFQS